MTKPNSRCIDIRQEHPLMDKFKEWYRLIYNISPANVFWGFDIVSASWSEYAMSPVPLPPKIITLEEWRERRGKEYYEKPRK